MRTEKEVLQEIARIKSELGKHKNSLAEKINGQTNLFESSQVEYSLFNVSIDPGKENITRILSAYHNNMQRLSNELNLIRTQRPLPEQIKLF